MSDSLDNFVSDAFDALNETSQQPTILTGAPSEPGTALGTLPGHAVGGFIARGGMGAIYRAKQMALEREVAVKVMISAAESPEMVERFRREALVVGRLEHPNIVPIHDLGTDEEGQLFYTMKLVKGRTLQAILNDLRGEDTGSVGPYSLASLLTVFRKVCDAVAFAHSQGVLHRDLKPENIMVGEFGEVLVMDWGLAKLLRNSGDGPETENSRLLPDEVRHPSSAIGATLVGSVMGTPQYMSPEQAMGRIDELDERSDIFALGGILYAILTLRPPVEGKTLEEVLNKVRTAEITSPSEMQAGSSTNGKAKVKSEVLEAKLIKPLPHVAGGRVPTALSSVVMKALRLDKAQRYQSVAELSADIEAYQAGFATKAEQAGTLKQIKLLMLRHKAVTALLAIMLTMSVGFVLRVLASERKATHNAAIATANEHRANENAEQTRRALMNSQIAVADAGFRSADLPAMSRALDAVPEDLRDQRWDYLSAKRDSSIRDSAISRLKETNVFKAIPGQPDLFAIADSNGRIAIMNVVSGETVRTIQTPFLRQVTLAVSADGQTLAITALKSAEIGIYQISDGAARIVPSPSVNVNSLALSPDGRILVVCWSISGNEGQSGMILVDARDGAVIKTLPYAVIVEAVFSPDGKRLFFPSGGGFKIIDPTSGELISTSTEHIDKMAISGDGKLLALSPKTGEVVILDVATGKELRRARLHQGKVIGIAWTRGGSLLTIGGEGLTDLQSLQPRLVIRLWDSTNFTPCGTFFGFHGNQSGARYDFNPLSGHLLIKQTGMQLWRIPVDLEVARFHSQISDEGYTACFLNDTTLLGRLNFTVIRYDVTQPHEPKAVPPQSPRGWGLAAVHRTSERVAVGRRWANTGEIKIYNTQDGKMEELREIPIPSPIEALDFDTSGNRLVAVSLRTGLFVVDVNTGETLLKMPQKVMKAVFVGTRNRIAGIVPGKRTADAIEDSLTLFDASSGEAVKSIAYPTSQLALAVSEDRKLIAVGGSEQVIRVLDADTLEERASFRAHDGDIRALAFHPSLPVIVSGSADGSVKLWDYETAMLREEFYGFPGSPLSLAISPNGRLLYVDGTGRSGRLFELGK